MGHVYALPAGDATYKHLTGQDYLTKEYINGLYQPLKKTEKKKNI